MRLRNIKGSRDVIGASDYVIHDEQEQKGKWQEVFGNEHPIQVEIGMGKGQFITTLAQQNPDINYIGVEGLYKKDDSYLASYEFADKMHATGQLVWGNAIIYDYLDQLSGGHSDDSALCQDMEYGWGWFAERPFDVIQTDWTGMLVQFLKDTGRYYRK